MKPATHERVLLVISGCLFLAVEGRTQGSCVSHLVHAFPGVCEGGIWLECDGVDSVVWSNGQSGFSVNGPPGTYSYDAYSGGELVYSSLAVIESHGWEFMDISGHPGSTGFWLHGSADIAYCGTSIWNSPCCSPEPGAVQIFAIQDGLVPITGPCIMCTNYPCFGTTFMFTELEYGHEYCVRLVDSQCGVTLDATEQCVIAHSCANLALDVSVLPSIPGGSTGVIELIEAIPDTTEPYPISSPVLGTITLFSLPSYQQVGQGIYNTGVALWNDLDTGYYVISFQPDAGCQAAYDTLYVPAEMNTGAFGVAVAPALRIAPTVTDGMLLLSSSAGSAPVHVRIVDIRGRTVAMMVVPPGPLSVEGLAQGSYVLVATQGEIIFRNRFIKR